MKTIVKFTAVALLAVSAAAPAFAFNPEAQLLDERSMAVGQNQAHGSYAQVSGAPVITVAPEAQLLNERTYQDQAFNAHAEVHSWAGTRR